MSQELLVRTAMQEDFSDIAGILQLDAQLLGDYSVKAVDGRHLQDALGNTKKHTVWAQQQIGTLSLAQGRDYEILSDLRVPSGELGEISQKTPPLRPMITYYFTVDAAKTIAMVSKSANGSRVRRYFLFMERVAQEAHRGNLPVLPQSPKAIDEALDMATRRSQYLKAAMGDSWSQGYHQKVTHEQYKSAGDHFGVDIVSMLPAPTVMLPGQKTTVELSEGVHFQTKAVGALELTTEAIKSAVLHGTLIKGVSFNDIMEHLGYINRLWVPKKCKHSRAGLAGVQATGKMPQEWATSVKFGPKTSFPGQLYVKVWHYNAFPDSLRKEMLDAAAKIGGVKFGGKK